MIMTRASRVFAALEPTPALPEWLVAMQAERAAEAARLATQETEWLAVMARWAR